MPSVASIIFVSIFLTQVFWGSQGLLSDCDTGYHIRAGEQISENFSILKSDIFSFHSPPLPWVAHEWLSEIIMAAIHNTSGLTGITIFFSLLISVVYFALYKILRVITGNMITAGILIIIVIASSQMHWLARPHLFSMLLMLIWYYLLDLNQNNNQRYVLFLQIPLMLLWVNLHAGFIAGFMLNGIYIAGNMTKLVGSQEAERIHLKHKLIVLGVTSGACLLAALANPYGYQIFLFPFRLINEKYIIDRIGEFLSPNFHLPWMVPFELFLILIFTVFAASEDRLNIIEIALISCFLHMSLISARYIPLFCIIAAPIVAKQAKLLLKSSSGKIYHIINKKGASYSAIDSSGNDYLLPAAAITIVLLLAFSGQIKATFSSDTKPVDAALFLEQEKIHGNMFNKDEFGDYLIYRNFPAYKVFIDGRIDMYGADMLKEYNKVISFEPGWENIIDKYDIKWIIYDSKAAFSRFLMQNNNWHLIYADKVASIFLKDTPENRPLIKKYKNAERITINSE